ncbi:hypothetical protein [Promicromonospora soli]
MLELDMFEARNEALRERLAADAELNERLAGLPEGRPLRQILCGLEAWEASFSVLRRVAAVGGVPREHPAYEGCQLAGDEVDVGLGSVPAGPERDELIAALLAYIEATRTVAAYEHIAPRAWWSAG